MCKDMPRTVEVPDDEILDAFDSSPGPVATVSDLDKVLSIKASAIRKRLKNLEEEGRVTSKKVGARATVWYQED